MTLRDQAYQRFTRGLLAREIRPGQFVTQRELSELTGMSLGAIREMMASSGRCPSGACRSRRSTST
jgi:DNA-binding GntR family transcriptional regulator